MRNGRERLITGAALLLVSAVALPACSSKPAPPADSGLTPVGTLRDVMENIVEPSADVIFDAVVVDTNLTGTVDHRPTTDAEWQVVQHSALMLAEATNLIKMPRAIAKPGDENTKSDANAPELTPAQIRSRRTPTPRSGSCMRTDCATPASRRSTRQTPRMPMRCSKSATASTRPARIAISSIGTRRQEERAGGIEKAGKAGPGTPPPKK